MQQNVSFNPIVKCQFFKDQPSGQTIKHNTYTHLSDKESSRGNCEPRKSNIYTAFFTTPSSNLSLPKNNDTPQILQNTHFLIKATTISKLDNLKPMDVDTSLLL